MNYFVTAIGTDSGKTVVSAILAEALQADYWKPVQAGQPTDSDTIRSLISNPLTVVHPEAVYLEMPASPHAAAQAEGRTLNLSEINLPASVREPLIIEGAGGCLVPLNSHESIIDLVPHLNARVILVSNHYLGSINHTLLTAALLKQRNYPVAGIIFNGNPAPGTEEVILSRTNLPCLLRLAKHDKISKALVREYAEKLKGVL